MKPQNLPPGSIAADGPFTVWVIDVLDIPGDSVFRLGTFRTLEEAKKAAEEYVHPGYMCVIDAGSDLAVAKVVCVRS